MRTREFAKIKKNILLVDVDKLLSDYMSGKVYFTNAQLDYLCERSSHHGGANFKYYGGKK
ncbi:MAG: hypothetical protein MJ245_00355 [Clostridia bacterium]|nr:hypothetical protein [Clostridia bacterium]